jgi:5-methylcytosine-specific restriction endonuclease McrA
VRVFVLDTKRQPLDPCHPARARQLLKKGHAAVFRRFPFTIILLVRQADTCTVHPHRLKIDPGARTTGLAILQERSGQVVWAAELVHRGQQIHKAMTSRGERRKGRRYRHTRYRQPRFHHRLRRRGWLPPSLESRVSNILTWSARVRRVCPITLVSQELVRFDTQALQNPEISGTEYQRGELKGYEIREYVLEKWGRHCAYCGAGDVPLQIDHIVARSNHGSDRVSNLTLACQACNQRKGNRPIAEYLSKEPEVLRRILSHANAPLRDAAAVNTTRWELYHRLKALGFPLEVGTGGRTKFNRTQRGLPKTHWLDAVCVGASTPERLLLKGIRPVQIKAVGHGRRQRCVTDKYGFPLGHAPQAKKFLGFQTGDIVRAQIPLGKYRGVHVGRVSIRFRPSFSLHGFDVHPKYLRRLFRADGYDYLWTASSPFSSANEHSNV